MAELTKARYILKHRAFDAPSQKGGAPKKVVVTLTEARRPVMKVYSSRGLDGVENYDSNKVRGYLERGVEVKLRGFSRLEKHYLMKNLGMGYRTATVPDINGKG